MTRELRWYEPSRWMRWSIRLYQRTISARTGSNCRYLPTCSAYTIEAIETHGAMRGLWLGTKRIIHCNPWATDGYVHQPVPPAKGMTNA